MPEVTLDLGLLLNARWCHRDVSPRARSGTAHHKLLIVLHLVREMHSDYNNRMDASTQESFPQLSDIQDSGRHT